MAQDLTVAVERFPIAGPVHIARGSRTEAVVVTATIADGGAVGRGECVPYARYGETVEGVAAAIEAHAAPRSRAGSTASRFRKRCRRAPPATRSTARCGTSTPSAAGVPAHVARRHRPPAAGYDRLHDQPRRARRDGRRPPRKAAERPILKIKLGAPERRPRRGSRRCARAAPDATLIADANEGWSGGDPRPASRGLRRGGVRAHRAAASGRERTGACAASAAGADLRRRERARPARPRPARRALRRDQHQARQDRRPDRGAGARRAAERRGFCPHDRLHGRDLARHGARRCCSRRAPASSTSTARCSSPAIARTGCATRAASSTRRRRRCGAERASFARPRVRRRGRRRRAAPSAGTPGPGRPEDRAARNRAGRHGERWGCAHHALRAAARRLRRESARAAMVPRWVAPKVRPCSICSAKVAGRPGSNAIAAKRKTAAAPASIRPKGAPRNDLLAERREDEDLGNDANRPKPADGRAREAEVAPMDAAEGIKRRVARLGAGGGADDVPEGRRHRFQVRRFGGALRNVNRFEPGSGGGPIHTTATPERESAARSHTIMPAPAAPIMYPELMFAARKAIEPQSRMRP